MTFLPQQVIARKRDGHVLSSDEIAAFVRGATDGSWADYQLSAMLMAIFVRGMTTVETVALTDAMMKSGVVADLSSVKAPKVDKHSTGGVGDKISIHLAPMIAACGVAVPMISGRGLGHTGGTLDKLEAIPGFRVGLSLEEYRERVERVGCALIGQTKDLAPADKKLYALRDVTATVECLPLICASIMCKKLAEGIDALVLDVKFGGGAFMKKKEDARALAQAMVDIGNAMGKPTRALLTAMDQPLGRAVGNALEVAECVECLKGNGPADLMEVTYALGAEMLCLAKVAKDAKDGETRLREVVANGAALKKFYEIVAAQGGGDLDAMPRAKFLKEVRATTGGYVQSVDAMTVALAALRLGAGRVKAEDAVDHAVGFTALVKIGERVAAGDVLAVVHANDEAKLAAAQAEIAKAVVIGDAEVLPVQLVDSVVG
ncbi:thymidine phosphorylase [Rariglobus hedericola]|uniref:thymidine phosphorylase n=1 Tax=Rariglobus hedericola TaxID=2597822 RepID=A0A556QJI9_9BACT|nr:thymidine phosphorylase [Rariglobus hedericola]TSJ76787.1 thymidine phosphorylase [Rariglobus hedericola]